MDESDLRNDETELIRTQGVYVKSIPFEGILTDKRIILIDRAKNLLPPKEIPLASIREAEPGENAIRDQIITLSIVGSGGDLRQMILTFSRQTGGNRVRDRDEWIQTLRQYTGSAFTRAMRRTAPAADQYREQTDREASPRIEVTGSYREPEPDTEPYRPTKRIIEKPLATQAAPAYQQPPAREAPAPSSRPIQQQPIQPAPDDSADFIYCTRCGNRLPVGSVFCNKCGNKVVVPKETAVSFVTPRAAPPAARPGPAAQQQPARQQPSAPAAPAADSGWDVGEYDRDEEPARPAAARTPPPPVYSDETAPDEIPAPVRAAPEARRQPAAGKPAKKGFLSGLFGGGKKVPPARKPAESVILPEPRPAPQPAYVRPPESMNPPRKARKKGFFASLFGPKKPPVRTQQSAAKKTVDDLGPSARPPRQSFLAGLFGRKKSPAYGSTPPRRSEQRSPAPRRSRGSSKGLVISIVIAVAVIAIAAIFVLFPDMISMPSLSDSGSGSSSSSGSSGSSGAAATATAAPAVTLAYTPKTTEVPSTGAYVYVDYIGAWDGEYGIDGATQQAWDSGTKVYQLSGTTGTVTATFEKLDASTKHPITVAIYKDGSALTTGTSNDKYGMVTVSADLASGTASAPVTQAQDKSSITIVTTTFVEETSTFSLYGTSNATAADNATETTTEETTST